MVRRYDTGARGTGAVAAVGIVFVVLGCAAIALALVGVPGSGWLFVGGLATCGLGAVLLKFGQAPDWWPGLVGKGF